MNIHKVPSAAQYHQKIANLHEEYPKFVFLKSQRVSQSGNGQHLLQETFVIALLINCLFQQPAVLQQFVGVSFKAHFERAKKQLIVN